MSTNRSRRIDRDTAEQLLAGAGAGAAPVHDALAELLAAVSAPAASAPAGGGELPGEQAAMAAFRSARRSARLAPVSSHTSASVAPRKRKMLTPAMLVGALAAVTLGGVAVATGTGRLPAALGGKPASSAPAPAASTPAFKGGEPTAGTLAGPAESVPADLAELCRAYAADGVPSLRKPSELLSEHRFAPLVAAAGGPAAVAGYCAPVLGGGQEETPAELPVPQPTDGRREASPRPDKTDKSSKTGKPEATKRPEEPVPAHTTGPRPTGKPDPGPTQPRNDAPTDRTP
ncbi:hypothetical protein ACFW6F_05730 [Streptomyces sp. NPDC058746]|uniref:hypothetical protein n=1 Tax=Streptomyces sp. NPDC058746 TaxID=3346622 RepID=UPI00369974C5